MVETMVGTMVGTMGHWWALHWGKTSPMLRGRQTGHGSTSLADGRPGEFLAISCKIVYIVFGCIRLYYIPAVTLCYLALLCYLVRSGNKPFTEISIEYNRVFCCWSAITCWLRAMLLGNQTGPGRNACCIEQNEAMEMNAWGVAWQSDDSDNLDDSDDSDDAQAASNRWPGFLQRILCIKGSLQACHILPYSAMMPPRAIGVRLKSAKLP